MKKIDKLKRLLFNKKKKLVIKDVKVSTKKQLDDILSLKEYLAELPCPNCKEKKLLLINYEMGKEGWEATVGCSKCLSKGVLNSTGLIFKLNVNKVLMEKE